MTAGIDIFLVIVSPRKLSFISLKASEIQVKCPYLYELFYDSEHKGTLWMCFDTNKQYLGADDVLNDYSLKSQKERLIKDNGGTGLFLHIKHKVEKLSTPNFYHSLSALHTQKKKILASSIKLQWGQQVPIYMTTLPEDKFPKEINTIYRYFTELCSTSSHSVTDTNKKQVNSPVITTEEVIWKKHRNWFIDIYISLGILLCDLSVINDKTSTYVTYIFKTLQKHIDINDGKLTNLHYKYNLMKKSYGCV
ncbi:unnamed protein product [Adineta steineri]|uniref:Tripeptidyl peptidase II second Ig-like domain-containing protein n=1 Tax=Adineta steineri TaxID=433720 RepID=A0A814IU00_9BILA|nr:unnamed protein product [Adineta steineri]CAF3956441.1 unnamed protein product [Adineta steineri]